MKYLIKHCTIVDSNSPHNGKKLDVLIENGEISQVAKNIENKKAEVIEGDNLHISIGWFDIGVQMGEPGNEQRETLSSLCDAARAGGYTDIAVFPQAIPTIEHAAQVKQLISAGKEYGVNIHPIGALSKSCKGDEITEYHEMNTAGAVAFSDGHHPVSKAGMLLRALQYAKAFDGTIIHHPVDESLSNENQIHEGEVSITLGMKGAPSLSENLMVNRDIQLQQYTESRLLLHNISTKESVDDIKAAKKGTKGLYSSTPYMNLILSDDKMIQFDSNYKVDPPLRGKNDRRALVAGIKNETIDIISSNHVPLESELKKLEYTYADAGTIGLQTCFAALITYSKLDLETIIQAITVGPREALKLPIPTIKEGEKGTFTVFDPTEKWEYNLDTNRSLSENNPFLGKELVGKSIILVQ